MNMPSWRTGHYLCDAKWNRCKRTEEIRNGKINNKVINGISHLWPLVNDCDYQSVSNQAGQQNEGEAKTFSDLNWKGDV